MREDERRGGRRIDIRANSGGDAEVHSRAGVELRLEYAQGFESDSETDSTVSTETTAEMKSTVDTETCWKLSLESGFELISKSASERRY